MRLKATSFMPSAHLMGAPSAPSRDTEAQPCAQTPGGEGRAGPACQLCSVASWGLCLPETLKHLFRSRLLIVTVQTQCLQRQVHMAGSPSK